VCVLMCVREYVCMQVCMCVCVCVCAWGCMYVCMYVCVNIFHLYLLGVCVPLRGQQRAHPSPTHEWGREEARE
jgi:hypothetical protein